MTKTIEELAKLIAKDFIIENKSRINNDAPLTHECVQYAVERIFAMPLSERLTAEEKERVRKMYKGELEFAQFYQRKANSCCNQQCKMDYEASRDIAKSRANMLESIFGADFFKEGE